MSEPALEALNADALNAVAEPEAVVAEPEVVAEPAAEPEPVAEPAAEPAKPAKPSGMLAELIEERTLRKQYEGQLRDLSPVLSRITPELRDAITDGRVQVQPKATTADARHAQLTKTAEDLRLYRDDGAGNQVLDLDAAERVDRVVRQAATEAARPAQEAVQQFQTMTLRQQAQTNIAAAVDYAKANGYDVDFVKAEFEQQAALNPAAMANSELAMQLWDLTLGKMTRLGKMPKAAKEKEPSPAVVVAEATGKRGPTVTRVDAKIAKVYRENGLDPAKPVKTFEPDRNGAIALE